MRICAANRATVVVLLAGIFVSVLLPRTVIVPAPTAEYRTAITTSVHVAQDDIAAEPVAGLIALFTALLLVAFVAVRLPLVRVRTIRRELLLIARRVRAPGPLVETSISTAEGRRTWPPQHAHAAARGRRASLVTIAA